MSDWIEHDGLGAPDLPHETMVDVRLRGDDLDRNGGFITTIAWWHGDGRHSQWIHLGDEDDIVTYRVVPK